MTSSAYYISIYSYFYNSITRRQFVLATCPPDGAEITDNTARTTAVCALSLSGQRGARCLMP